MIVTNPVSNMKLAVGGVFPYAAARERGIPVGLGTDGAASNNSLDLMADTKFLSLLQKHAANDPGGDAGARGVGGRHRSARRDARPARPPRGRARPPT